MIFFVVAPGYAQFPPGMRPGFNATYAAPGAVYSATVSTYPVSNY